MLWPLFYGSSSCASTCLRATSLVPRTGWTQPSTVVPLSVASSASLLLWQLANHRVYEEANTEDILQAALQRPPSATSQLCSLQTWQSPSSPPHPRTSPSSSAANRVVTSATIRPRPCLGDSAGDSALAPCPP